MGNMRACSAFALLALAACGSDHAKPDAQIIIPDAAIDAKVWEDAPPPSYDLSCYGGSAPTTAANPISIAGTTGTVGQGGQLTPVPNIPVDVFKTGTNTPAGTDISDNSGAFMISNIVTGGVPLDGYLRATDLGAMRIYRTSYLYPPSPITADLTGVPVTMISQQNFDFVRNIAQAQQDDANNGALLVLVVDCSMMPIAEATITVKQNGADVGTIFGLGALLPQAAGTFFVFDVPDGGTDIVATYNNMTFPMRTVAAHKKPPGPNSMGTLTTTAVRPGP